MFDGKFIGYVAVGNEILFRPAAGADVHVLYSPEDVDSHVLANALNDAANSVFAFVREITQFKI
jgi:hypothetical protein